MDIIKPEHREELTLLSIISTNVATIISAFGYWIFRDEIESMYNIENSDYFIYTLLFISAWLSMIILIGWAGYGKKRFVHGVRDRSLIIGLITIILMGIYYIFIARNLFGVTALCMSEIEEIGKMCAIITLLIFLLVGILLFSQIIAVVYYVLSLIGMVGRIILAALDFILTHWAFCGICLGLFLMAGGSFAYFKGLEQYAPLPVVGLILVIVILLAKWADEIYFIIELIKKLWFPILIIIIIYIAIYYFGFNYGLCFDIYKDIEVI